MSNATITSAVVAAAGAATRMWPASKVIPKELFPLGRLPAVAYLVQEFIDAGIENIVFVVREETRPLLESLFDVSKPAPERVRHFPEVQRFETSISRAKFQFIVQSGPYGNGTPLINGSELIGDEPFIYAFSDDIVLGENVSAGLIETYKKTKSPILAAQQVDPSRVGSFGILECSKVNGFQYVSRMIEKPEPGETSSTLAAFGRYLVTPEILEILKNTPVGNAGELWFVDSVIEYIRRGGSVCSHTLKTGRWYTVGDPVGYSEAVIAAADLQ